MHDKIIKYLRESQAYVSGEDLSKKLKISRAAIWKYIEELRKEGYVIDAVKHMGYKLVSAPDRLYPREIQSGLMARTFGKNIFYYDSLESTMDEARRLALGGEAEGTVVCAEGQTKGKGRLGRSWSSPKRKGIYASVILRPRLSPSEGAKLTLLAAVSVCEAIRNVTGMEARIKWPNDCLVEGKKIAGILTEMSAEMDSIRFVILGIGVNVNTSAGQIPAQASSLKIEKGKGVSRIVLFREILLLFENWYRRVEEKGFDDLIGRWKELSSTLGHRIRIVDPSGVVEGTAIDLDEFGGLVIKNGNGNIIKKMSGDVVQV